MFSGKDCEIFKNTHFDEHLRTAASKNRRPLKEYIALALKKIKFQ